MIQFSAQTFVCAQFPILRQRPCFNSSLPWRLLRHAKEGHDPLPHSRKDVRAKYLPFRTLAMRKSGWFQILHACLHNKAWLKRPISWKPMPQPLWLYIIFAMPPTGFYASYCHCSTKIRWWHWLIWHTDLLVGERWTWHKWRVLAQQIWSALLWPHGEGFRIPSLQSTFQLLLYKV